MIRALLMARASFRWCKEQTPVRREGKILAWGSVNSRKPVPSL